MGTKRFLKLAGLLLAGAAFVGCQNGSNQWAPGRNPGSGSSSMARNGVTNQGTTTNQGSTAFMPQGSSTGMVNGGMPQQQQFGAGSQQFGAGSQQFGAGSQQFGAGSQQIGAGTSPDWRQSTQPAGFNNNMTKPSTPNYGAPPAVNPAVDPVPQKVGSSPAAPAMQFTPGMGNSVTVPEGPPPVTPPVVTPPSVTPPSNLGTNTTYTSPPAQPVGTTPSSATNLNLQAPTTVPVPGVVSPPAPGPVR
jgi:hypothetical protein